jgi:hypothetical protein
VWRLCVVHFCNHTKRFAEVTDELAIAPNRVRKYEIQELTFLVRGPLSVRALQFLCHGEERDAFLMGRAACPRGLRHAFGVGTLQAGIPLNLTQRWMGHARISTTAIYTKVCGPDEFAFAQRYWESFSARGLSRPAVDPARHQPPRSAQLRRSRDVAAK